MSDNLLLSYSKRDSQSSQSSQSSSLKRIGIYLSALFGGTALIILSISYPFISPAFRRIVLPFVPATDNQINNIITYLKRVPKGSTLIDLGSGDGRIVIESAKLGINSCGVELNPWLVLYSKIRSHIYGVNQLTTFKRQNLWTVNTSQYDNIVIFGVHQMMPLIRDKIESDCKLNNRRVNVIACRFELTHLKPLEIIGTGIDTVWVYQCPSN